MIHRYEAMAKLQKEIDPDSDDEPTQTTPREIVPIKKPFSLMTLLVHLLRYSSEPGISRTQLSVITSWPIKRLASRLRQLETDGVIRSQLKNYGRKFVVERNMEVSIPDSSSIYKNSTKRLSDVAITRRQLLLDLVGVKWRYD